MPEPGLLTRAVGVIVSPRQTFERLVARPKVAGALLFVTIFAVVLSAGFMASHRGRDAFFDMMYDRIQQGGGTAEQQAAAQQGIDRLQTMATDHTGVFVFFTSAANLILLPVSMTIVGGLFFVVFNVVMGGTATFKQVMAVVTHASFVLSLQQLVTVPLNLIRGSMTSATNFAVLFPMFDETSFMGRLLGTLDLFAIWGTIVMAIGLAVLYRRKTRTIAIALFVVYAIVAVLIAFLRSR